MGKLTLDPITRTFQLRLRKDNVLPGIPFMLKSGTGTSFGMLFGALDLGGSGNTSVAEGGIPPKLFGVSGKTG